jgi:hypothetical protein
MVTMDQKLSFAEATPSVSQGLTGNNAYHQLTADSGSGASLGGFKGRAIAIGGSIGYDFAIGQLPISTRLRYYHELEVDNRLKGDAAFLSVSMPLWVDGAARR